MILVLVALMTPLSPLSAQSEARVQKLSGVITGPGDIDVYLLSGLLAGDTLTAHMNTTSGDLDPLLMLVAADSDLPQLLSEYQSEVGALVLANGNIAADIVELRDRYTLAWDDDSGEGYAAALAYEIETSGDYLLLAGSALSTLGRNTFGSYELLVGINAPNVLEGTAAPTEDQFVTIQRSLLPPVSSVEEAAGLISGPAPRVHALGAISSDTTIYVYVESTSPDLRPAIILRDYGGKPLAAANLSQSDSVATLEYRIAEGGAGYTIEVQGGAESSEPDEQDGYRLLIGANAPEVLTGSAEPRGEAILKKPIIVQTGIKLNRISGVESREESFTMLGSVRMDWTDPAYAFSPDECNCTVKVFTDEDFRNFLIAVGSRWPDFTFFNQLGPRASQSVAVAIWSDGRARYAEDFTTTIQADFDFRQFPFDTQTFPVYMDMVFAENNYIQEILPGYSSISSDHGEDEFIINEFSTIISTVPGPATDNPASRFTFAFSAPRHMDYYIFQIFVPIILIGLISWFTFFLRDYTRRIEAAAANVLLFIAFSFSLSDNYPRLGYLTFLDAIMLVAFIVNTVVILYNVFLKQLETKGQLEKAEHIDRYLDWVYPVSYVFAIGIVVWLFFGRV